MVTQNGFASATVVLLKKLVLKVCYIKIHVVAAVKLVLLEKILLKQYYYLLIMILKNRLSLMIVCPQQASIFVLILEFIQMDN